MAWLAFGFSILWGIFQWDFTLKIIHRNFPTLNSKVISIILGFLAVSTWTFQGYVIYQNQDASFKLEKDLNAVKNYSYVATLNRYGGTIGMHLPEPGYWSDFGLAIYKYSTFDYANSSGNSVPSYFHCNQDVLQTIDNFIDSEPTNPWGPYHKAICLFKSYDWRWRTWASKALEIFNITTSIQNHNADQDDARKELQGMLEI